jgi:indolepyruvate ferredoxin oxidoreductase, beta subunit
MKSCLICGVGGQGIVLASRIIAAAAIEKGYMARTAETIGMAQRGGCVVSHVRFGDKVSSPMIPFGKADVMIGFEPGEIVRNLHYLKKDGVVIVCKKDIQPVTASLSGTDYTGKVMLEYLKKNITKCYIIDGEKICEECGSPKVLNVALVGAMAKCQALDLTVSDIDKVLKQKIKPQFLGMNRKALELGAQCE